MAEDFIADVPREGEIRPEDTETDTQPESQPDTKPTDTTEDSSPSATKQDEGRTLPFNEDPKVQDYISRQVENRIQEELQKKFSPKEEVTVPPYWNGDAESFRLFQEDQRRLAAEEAENRVRALKQESETEQRRIKEANDWFEQSVADIEKEGTKVDRNKLLKKAMDEQLIDAQGRWHYKAAFRLLQAEEKEPSSNKNARKQIAQVTESVGEPSPRDYKTTDDFKRHRPW